MAIVNTLLKAVKRKWDADPNLSSFFKAFTLSQVPEVVGTERVDLPYAYLVNGRTNFLFTYGSFSAEVNSLEFILFVANSGEEMERAVGMVEDTFNWCQLTFDDTSLASVYFQPVDQSVTCLPVEYRDGSQIYRASLTYESFVNRTLPTYPPHPLKT